MTQEATYRKGVYEKTIIGFDLTSNANHFCYVQSKVCQVMYVQQMKKKLDYAILSYKIITPFLLVGRIGYIMFSQEITP